MCIKKKYLFLGGPWHGRTELTAGTPYIQVPEAQSSPFITGPVVTEFLIFKEYTYRLHELTLGNDKRISVYILGPNEVVSDLFSQFLLDLFNMYVEA